MVPKLFLIAYHLRVPYCHRVYTTLFQENSIYQISFDHKSLEDQNWHKRNMNKMTVRNC